MRAGVPSAPPTQALRRAPEARSHRAGAPPSENTRTHAPQARRCRTRDVTLLPSCCCTLFGEHAKSHGSRLRRGAALPFKPSRALGRFGLPAAAPFKPWVNTFPPDGRSFPSRRPTFSTPFTNCRRCSLLVARVRSRRAAAWPRARWRTPCRTVHRVRPPPRPPRGGSAAARARRRRGGSSREGRARRPRRCGARAAPRRESPPQPCCRSPPRPPLPLRTPPRSACACCRYVQRATRHPSRLSRKPARSCAGARPRAPEAAPSQRKCSSGVYSEHVRPYSCKESQALARGGDSSRQSIRKMHARAVAPVWLRLPLSLPVRVFRGSV